MPKFNFKFSILGVKIKNRLPVSPQNQSHICKCFSMSLRGPEELVERTKVEGGGGNKYFNISSRINLFSSSPPLQCCGAGPTLTGSGSGFRLPASVPAPGSG